ncbi:MAG: ParB N-terminal domain-containing protein [Acidobacteriaceae bacterium]|nr:ParB N-terminal domain-containing protein [Acidobacteriaceae bacterium]
MTNLSLDLIEPGKRLRDVNDEQVTALIASISDVGLLHPISVCPQRVMRGGVLIDGYGLVAGLHRLEATRRMGGESIAAHIVTLSDLQRQIAECDENLCGTKLTPSERALFTKRRKEAYEALHPETRRDATLKRGEESPSRQIGETGKPDRFTAATAAATGHSERAVQRDAERGSNITSAALDAIKGTSLDKGVVLDAVAKVSPERQLSYIKQEAEKREAQKRNRETDNAIAYTEAQQFADWLLARTDLHELPTLISWLEGCKPKDVIRALRREAA